MRMVLRDARIAKKISVSEMARRLNISTSFYYKIEQGIRNPTIDLAKAIADILQSTIDELFCTHELDDSYKKPKDPAPAEAVNH
ncbi:MAG: helix-turn-helix domain-containing protein [Moorellaceae bacterium]